MGFYMDLTFGEKIRIILNRQNKSIDDLAGALGMSRQNLWQQLNRDNFKEKDMERIAAALGYNLNIELTEKATPAAEGPEGSQNGDD